MCVLLLWPATRYELIKLPFYVSLSRFRSHFSTSALSHPNKRITKNFNISPQLPKPILAPHNWNGSAAAGSEESRKLLAPRASHMSHIYKYARINIPFRARALSQCIMLRPLDARAVQCVSPRDDTFILCFGMAPLNGCLCGRA